VKYRTYFGGPSLCSGKIPIYPLNTLTAHRVVHQSHTIQDSEQVRMINKKWDAVACSTAKTNNNPECIELNKSVSNVKNHNSRPKVNAHRLKAEVSTICTYLN